MLKLPRIPAALVVVLAVLGAPACAPKTPPNLTPAQTVMYQVNSSDVIVALGTVQHAAIELNKLQDCGTALVIKACTPVVSNANVEVVIDAVADAINTIKASPGGWKTTAAAALDRINARLDAAGKSKLTTYITIVKTAAGL